MRARRRRGHGRPPGRPAVIRRYLRLTGLEDPVEVWPRGWDGLALGAEFCVRRLPPPERVFDLARHCVDDGLGFSLVTPILREAEVEGVTRWLGAVVAERPGIEVVFNDWGLWGWAHAQGLPLTPVAGRMLGRQRRGPRVMGLTRGADPADARTLRGSVWDEPEALDRLAALGGVRIELDRLLQGTVPPQLPEGVGLSLCGPWIPVTVTPACRWSSDPLACTGTCTGHPAVRLKTLEDPTPLYTHGNAVMVHTGDAPPALYLAHLGVDRLVWSPRLPG